MGCASSGLRQICVKDSTLCHFGHDSGGGNPAWRFGSAGGRSAGPDKSTGGGYLDDGKYGQMAFQTRVDLPKSGHRMAAEGMPFPWRWNDDTISQNLDVIWGTSVRAGSPLTIEFGSGRANGPVRPALVTHVRLPWATARFYNYGQSAKPEDAPRKRRGRTNEKDSSPCRTQARPPRRT